MMEIWGNRALGRKALVFALALVVGLAVWGRRRQTWFKTRRPKTNTARRSHRL